MKNPEVYRRDESGRVVKIGYLRDRPFGVIGEKRQYIGPLLEEDRVVRAGERGDDEQAE